MNKHELITKKLDNAKLIKIAKSLKNEGIVLQTKNYTYLKISDDFIHELYPLIAQNKDLQEPNYFNKENNIGAHQ